MLGCHPDLYAFPEFQLFSFPTIGQLLADDERVQAERGIRLGSSAGIIRALIDLNSLPNDEAGLNEALDWLKARAHWTNEQLLAWLKDAIHPRTPVAKSTSLGQDPDLLWRLRSTVPGARFIHLLRHPIITIQSQLDIVAKTEQHPARYAPYIASVLLHHHQFIDAFLSTISPADSVSVQAERLLSDSQSLAGLARRMGLRSDDAAILAMRHPENWTFARPGPTPLEAEGDLEFFSDPRLRPAESDPICSIPSQWELAPQLQNELTKLASDNGYRISP
jgi:hypothetical protein